ncbi:proline dehydrogenase family protein [Planomonospora venezuelensis]|uniref:proline dehydrogenase n=1 Tax=Planomonospora venezuelensis TaxID=1999 RepID=A0A841D593_PLAVE|nr:proline dehydrogenase family protein [Planomonospora venezuelensis]MBB5964649.1 proline dehydrogenase [Planomonospora venezuelensis]GIN03056.1 proline dehydrogenase [Planomonospora venezuelensis]
MFGQLLLAGSRAPLVRRAVSGVPLTRKVVDRFVAGETVQDAVGAVRRLAGAGLTVTIDHLGEETRDAGAAAQTAEAYTVLLGALRELELGDRTGPAGLTEVSVKLSAVGQALGADGDKIALEHARTICEAAHAAGASVTLDMEDHTTVDSTLGILRALRADFPGTGVAVQAYLFRSEADCRDLSHEGSRVRLVKGAYAEPASVAHQKKNDVDKAYVRCLRILMAGKGYPMVATHDDRLISITETLADRFSRARGDYEYQMLYGIRTDKQQALAGAGHTVRVYVPYGDDWYGYFMRRLAERPANVAFFLRALGGK